MSNSFAYGVDFGMTTSSLAIMADTGEVSLAREPDPGIAGDWSYAVPTAVCLSGTAPTDLLVGQAALNARAGHPEAFLDNFKREVGVVSRVDINGQPFTMVELVAAVLRFLYDRAQEVIPGAPSATVLTAPASWAGNRRGIIKAAAIDAGYPRDSLFIVDEPTAALEYARFCGLISERPTALVYDLGGSTLDCAVIRPGRPGLPDPRAIRGVGLGGVDFDLAIVADVKRRFPVQYAEIEDGELGQREPWRLVRLQRVCEQVKCRLSADEVAREILYDLPGNPELTLTRSEFERLIASTVDETIATAEHTVADMGLTWEEIDVVLPVGGSTLVPLVADRLAGKAPGKLVEVQDRDCVPAFGAAVMAGREADRLDAGAKPVSAELVTAHPWIAHANSEEPPIADASPPAAPFRRSWLVAGWLALLTLDVGGSLFAWQYWDIALQVITGLWCLGSLITAVVITIRPHEGSGIARAAAGYTIFTVPPVLVSSILFLTHRELTPGFWSLGICVFLAIPATIFDTATTRAKKAVGRIRAFDNDEAVIKAVTSARWFEDADGEIPGFLQPLFEIPALRGFRIPAGEGELRRYALAAGNNVLLVAMLTSPDRRPVLEQWERSLGLTLPRGSARTILVAPGPVPPPVPANEGFESGALITTERSMADIVGRWLERDNRLFIPVLSSLLRSTRNAANPAA